MMDSNILDISKNEKVARFVEETGASEEDARDYLEAEAWLYAEAVYMWKADAAAEIERNRHENSD